MTNFSKFIDKLDRVETRHNEQDYVVVKYNNDYRRESNFITGKNKITENTSWTPTSHGIGIAKLICNLLSAYGPTLISQSIKLLKK